MPTDNNVTQAAELSCKEAARLMSRKQDADLSAAELESLKLHLVECLSCRRFDEQLGFLRRMAQQYGKDGPPAADEPV